MKNLLFLVHRIPYPPNKGDKIRSFNLLKYLHGKYNVILAGFVDQEEDWQYVSPLEEFCSESYFRPIRPWHARVSAATALLRRDSLSIAFYSDNALKAWVSKQFATRQIDAVICFSSTMAQFVPPERFRDTVVVADFVDLDSDKWRQYSAESKWPLSMLYSYEAGALAKYEDDVVGKADSVTLVSDAERQLLLSRSKQPLQNIGVVRNGVDIDLFDPALPLENPYTSGNPVAVFTGAMDYFANVQGVKWFVEQIWPAVRDKVPSAEFWIVGSNPTKDVCDLESVEGVVVTGFVDDVRCYLQHATVAVAPLMLARGVQNKVLEALAMNLPVIATRQALQGLDGDLPPTISGQNEIAGFAVATVQGLQGNRLGVGSVGRDYVTENYDWDRNLSEVHSILTKSFESQLA